MTINKEIPQEPIENVPVNSRESQGSELSYEKVLGEGGAALTSHIVEKVGPAAVKAVEPTLVIEAQANGADPAKEASLLEDEQRLFGVASGSDQTIPWVEVVERLQ